MLSPRTTVINRHLQKNYNMDNIIIKGLSILAAGALLFACSPMDKDDHQLGQMATEEGLSFTQASSAESANIITFTNTSDVKGVALWDLGNGSSAKGDAVTGQYPFKGDYTVTMTLYTAGGAVSTSSVITVANDDYSLLDTPGFNALTGGADNLEGKTWVFARYTVGHFGVGPADDAPGSGPSWWACPVNGKDGSSLYSQKFTFIQKGTVMKWENDGRIYTNENGMNMLGISGTLNPVVGDYDVPYVPAESYTFTLDEASMTLTLSEGAFFGHYAGTSEYKILNLDEHELSIYCKSEAEPSNAWYYIFIPEEDLKEPEPETEPEAELTAVSLSEDFEGDLSFAFTAQDMGARTGVYSNPAPVAANSSAKVYAYEKSEAFYSNLSYVFEGKKMDLTENNKVRVKVFIPSYNDWTTEAGVAGDWITNAKLLPQLAVKLQDNSLGGDAWTTQTEIVKADLALDQWIELEFDFSGVADRTDYDKIVVQFGAEGHAAPGLFFFDDFTFGK